jgi:uncharacterized protein
MNALNSGTGPTPVTVLVTRQVRPGRAAEFERLMADMIAAANGFPGHVGGFVIPPQDSRSGCYLTLFAFDNEEHLRAWTHSPQRQGWLDRIAAVTYGDNALRVLTGMEGWFALPAADTRLPPPRHKMAVVTWLGIFPLVLVLSALITPLLAPIHPVLSVMVVTALVTAAMTWLVMPRLVRLFAGWLYPKPVTP